MLNAIWLITLGVLGASNLIIAKKPNAKEVIEKIQPIQGWLGVVSAFYGAWALVQVILNISLYSGISLILALASTGSLLVLGFLLGLGILKTFVKDSTKLDELAIKLSPYQGTLGLVSIGLGVWVLLQVLKVL
ncbi:hypothetical protein [Candidatus Uabimicrobium sp. HlEnr_7]|uniref:hypothetical protein n=1 Tax=Candidatus Uabimicrobium helgolandensis TaxID=3095367 RepID=UPI003556563C